MKPDLVNFDPASGRIEQVGLSRSELLRMWALNLALENLDSRDRYEIEDLAERYIAYVERGS